MRDIKTQTLMALLLVFVSFPMVAEVFTLETLLQQTMQNNLELKLKQEEVSRLNIVLQKEVLSQRLTTLNVNGNASTEFTHLLSGGSSQALNTAGTAGVTLSKILYQFKGGRLSAKVKKSGYSVQMAVYALERKKQTLRKQVQHTYFDLLNALADQKEDQASLKRLREHARISGVFYEQGSVWKNDVLQSQVKIAQGEKQLISSRNSVRRHMAQLNRLMNRAIDADIEVLGTLMYRPVTVEWLQLKQRVDQNTHPDMLSILLAQQMSQTDVKMAQAENSPEVTVLGRYNNAYDFSQGRMSEDDVALSVSLSWPLWDSGVTEKEISLSKSAQIKSDIKVHEKSQEILLAVRNSWYNLEEAIGQLGVLKQALASAQENYRVNQVRYQEQLGSANDLLSAQDLLSASKKDWLASLAQYNKAIFTLQYDLGVDSLSFN